MPSKERDSIRLQPGRVEAFEATMAEKVGTDGQWAWVAVMNSHFDAKEFPWAIGICVRDQPGYWPLMGQTGFKTMDQASDYADELNARRGLESREAGEIVATSMREQARSGNGPSLDVETGLRWRDEHQGTGRPRWVAVDLAIMSDPQRDGRMIAKVDPHDFGHDAAHEHARLIVTAVNCHDELLAALKALPLDCAVDVLNPCWAGRPTDVPGRHWGGGAACPQCRARAAIAKAEGQPPKTT